LSARLWCPAEDVLEGGVLKVGWVQERGGSLVVAARWNRRDSGYSLLLQSSENDCHADEGRVARLRLFQGMLHEVYDLMDSRFCSPLGPLSGLEAAK